MPADWRRANLQQAKADFDMVKFLLGPSGPGFPRYHVLHYLQMTLEKAGKGLRTERGGPEPERTHKGAQVMLRMLNLGGTPSLREFHRRLGSRPEQRQARLRSLSSTAMVIERLAPANANITGQGVNAEYPWRKPGDPPEILAPALHPFGDPLLDRLRISMLVDMLDMLFQSLERTGELP